MSTNQPFVKLVDGNGDVIHSFEHNSSADTVIIFNDQVFVSNFATKYKEKNLKIDGSRWTEYYTLSKQVFHAK